MRLHEWWLSAVLVATIGCHRDIRKVGAFPADRSGIAVSMQPSRLFAPQAMMRMQQQLVARDLLTSQQVSGNLDGPTRDALLELQVAEKLAQTGLPNYKTVRALGLEPADIFLNQEPMAEKTPAPGAK